MNSFIPYLIISAAILIQFAAAVYALYLIKITKRRLGWILISTANLIMVTRRIFSLIAFYRIGAFSIFNELSGLIISIFMFIGMIAIKNYFFSILQAHRELSINKQELQKSQLELERINQSKDKLFSVISHDLKNPFNTLLNFSEIILKNYQNLPAEKLLDFLDRINKSAKRGYALLENLLHWSQFQTGTITIHPEKFEIKAKIAETILIFGEVAAAKNIKIINNLKKEFFVFADQQMITAVIRNLLSNALKFTENNGAITVSATELPQHLEISVSDSGVGINDTNMKKLFNLNTNYSTTGTGNEKGSGLGLILCRDFVEKNGGKIRVESEIGRGTKFSFTIPKQNL
ncbi:MAG: HAMP domain-containing sensor histidine kinase [Candidatus Cloacimonadales bacterium]|nr:HAMP domain-containing sensor histidine kinase [Candidatus Cloacimonadales bacterium]